MWWYYDIGCFSGPSLLVSVTERIGSFADTEW
jgi:hypothetical protein